MKIIPVLACLAASAIVASATALPAPAATTPQRLSACGQTITGQSAYLDRDLTCAQGFVTPRATDDSTDLSIDLRGHRLRGTGSGTGFSVGNNDPFFDSLEVRNGRVDHWGTGFFSAYASITITNVTIDHNDVGLYCGGSTCTISRSRLHDNKTGVVNVDSAVTFDQNR
jgi:hypothetical protein